jgi:hypothetical protein
VLCEFVSRMVDELCLERWVNVLCEFVSRMVDELLFV